MMHTIKSRIRGLLFIIYTTIGKGIIFNGRKAVIGHNTHINGTSKSRVVFEGNVRFEDNVAVAARESGIVRFGKNIFLNSGCKIICHEHINIGDNVQMGHNVIIVDHDHDFKCEGGITEGKFKCSPIEIGDNVWIGASTVILRGTIIGNNTVIGAGSVIKGVYPDNAVITQKREDKIQKNI